MNHWENLLREYCRNRPLFLSVLRAKEAYLYREFLPLSHPILDYGCGDGMFAYIAFKNGIDVGLDVENSRIREVRKQGVYKKIVIYDGVKIPFKNNHFATVISNSVLEHVDLIDNALREISRVIKPKGRFITTVMAKPWETHLFGAKILGDRYRKYMKKKQVHINLFTRKKWDESFAKSGFRIIKTVGHLGPQACVLMDILHYISVPSLISYKFFGKWVVWPKLADVLIPHRMLVNMTLENVDPDKSGALFYVLEKK